MGRRALERLAFEKGIRSGGRESACPRPMSLKTALFRLIDGSAVFEMAAFQKQNALGPVNTLPFCPPAACCRGWRTCKPCAENIGNCMETDFLAQINTLARVPEHSLPLMRAMSQGAPFCVGPYFFMAAADWLMAVAYPLRGRYSHANFEAALAEALKKSGATNCWAVGPDLPPRLHGHIVDRDRFYLLPAGAAPPARLRGPLRRAAAALRVEDRKSVV